jgi:hypothetical protein
LGLEWIQRLVNTLRHLRKAPDAPLLDIDWLLLRCEDTLRYEGELQQDSARQLVKDVADFERHSARLPRPATQG